MYEMAAHSKTHGDTEFNTWLSPIVLSENPGAVSPQRNLTGLPRVARDIAADVFNNIQQWNNNHIIGANVTRSIAQLKVDSAITYPNGLENLTNNLCDVVEKMCNISKALEFLASQMVSLVKVHKEPTALFLSLSSSELASLLMYISQAYATELKVKEHVLENIVHTKEISEVMFYAVCWVHQLNITNDVNLKLEMLLTETGHRKIP